MASNKGIVTFFRGVLAEIRKTTWPTAQEVKKTVAAVAFICLIYAILSGVADFVINLFFKNVLKLG